MICAWSPGQEMINFKPFENSVVHSRRWAKKAVSTVPYYPTSPQSRTLAPIHHNASLQHPYTNKHKATQQLRLLLGFEPYMSYDLQKFPYSSMEYSCQ